MNDKALVKKVLKKYRFNNNFYILQKSAVYIKNSYRITNRRKKSSRVYRAIEELLEQENFSIPIEMLARKVTSIKAPPLDDSELSLFNYSVCKCIFIRLLKEKDASFKNNFSALLRELDEFSFDSFYQNTSVVHRILLQNNPDSYRISDKDTQRHARRYVYAYAKKHRISEVSAAKIYKGGLSKPKPWGKLYIPILLILTLAISVFIGVFTGILPAILVILPIFEGLRTISTAILSKACIPSKIPALDISSVPDRGRTVAVITSLIDKNNTKDLLKKVEDYHNRTKDENVCIGILADLADSGEYYTNRDENDIKNLMQGFNVLNRKYGERFCLFIRQRSYIATEERYSGKERKRGAVMALCSLLTHNENYFDTVICPKKFLDSTAYLVTLDSDTEVGMKDISSMVAAMLHPNNRPIIKDGRVVQGHALLQPKIIPSLEGSTATPFTLTISGVGGHDGYRGVDFELYQTLFDRSTFCGKGIIDIYAFYALFSKAFKEERILSHDTLEGGYGRCGYLSHVTLTDSCPKNPISYYKRYHRWLRGDTQSLPFTANNILNAENQRIKNPLDTLGRIMIIDNFQRALLPVFIFSALIYAFFAPFKAAVLITLTAIFPIVLPFLLSLFSSAIPTPIKFYSNAIKGFCRGFCHMLFELSAIPTKALTALDAVLRALWRMTVSKKHLMQWVTAEAGERMNGKLAKYFIRFSPSLIIGAFTLFFAKNQFFDFFAVLWILFFLMCYCLGSEYSKKRKISKRYKNMLEKYCLDSWYYFSDLVNRETNYLPPDNYQISPVKKVAMRTSPTNIGLYLLTCGAAYKFGFIRGEELKERISSTLQTIDKLPKYRGHLYNWYDIKTLRVLGTPYVSTVDSGNLLACLYSLMQILNSIAAPLSFNDEIEKLKALCDNMPLGFLYNRKKGLFAIGIDTVTGEMGDNCYDILMSEVRTAVYIAVCRHEVDWEVYYKMGCPIISRKGHMGLASWSGTAFEYFMPALFLPIYQNSLSYESLGFSLYEQINDKVKGVWGRSESGYFAFDHDMNYQYRAFGAPSLAIDPEIAKHNVISPYSSFLSLCMSYHHPCTNLLKLEKLGMYGKYGFYEAIDFTKDRVGGGNAVIYSWMSHHLAMSILAACNACFDGYIVKSFMSNPEMRCGYTLLQRRIPVDIKLSREMQKRNEPPRVGNRYEIYQGGDEKKDEKNRLPQSGCYSNSIMSLSALSNGQLSFKYKNSALSYPFFDNENLRGFNLRAQINGQIFNPLSEAAFSRYLTGICYRKQEKGLDFTTSFSLHGEHNAICINLTVKGNFEEITSLMLFEPILDGVAAFDAHPAFSGLSVDCNYDRQAGILVYRRKRRENPHEALYLAVGIAGGGNFSFITRRDSAFDMLYNNEDINSLICREFDDLDGACINPVCIIKTSSDIGRKKDPKPSSGVYSIDFIIYSAESLNEIYKVQNKLKHDKTVHTKGYTAAFSKSLEGIAREQLTISGADREVIDLCSVLRSDFALNPYKNRQNGELSHTHRLYKYGISNDLPIVCLNLKDTPNSHMLNAIELFSRANRYMRCTSEPFDLVIITCGERAGNSYFSPQKTNLQKALEKWTGAFALNQRGGIYLIDRPDDKEAVASLARFAFDIEKNCVPAELIKKAASSYHGKEYQLTKKINGIDKKSTKGFFEESSFIIKKGISKRPWSYTYSNRYFGTLVTHNSLGFTWFGNSKQSRLTPWSNDPLLDLSGEALIIRIGKKEYDLAAISSTVEFKKGQAVYSGSFGGIDYTVTVGISLKLPFKYILFSAVNQNPAKTEFSVYLKVTPALGSGRGCSYKATQSDGMTIYTNINSMDMGNISMFASDGERKFTLDNGSVANASFILGAVNKKNDKAFYKILSMSQDKFFAEKLEKEYRDYFNEITSVFNLKSPFPELDNMFNFYAPYQAYCQRILARSGFYQSGGAYGFRDQLQDALSFVSAKPEILKKQILRCASKQFPKGDVLHWWHERAFGEFNVFGVRTRCSDDYLWLAYCTAVYVKTTGDKSILDYPVFYIEGEELKENEQERCMTIVKSDKKERLYYHCIRSIELCLSRRDENGLCLIGSCDWNDGFSNVGKEGKGTSIWLTRFLQILLILFSDLCDIHYKKLFLRESENLDRAVEDHGYNGEYYIRGFFASGAPLGDKDCEECKIDILPQAFSAIANGKNERTEKAIKKGIDVLFDRQSKILSLFSPPFENSIESPGYIMAYVPGTRENGGQYTHGALWGALGCFYVGENNTAFEILQGCNPAYRSSHPKLNKSYGGEPYAFSGDIYTNKDHYGRAGWTQYTGAAGWFYSIVLSELLGYREHMGKYFTVTPKLCHLFNEFTLTVKKKNTEYIINVTCGDKTEYILDDQIVNNSFIFDENRHFLKITVAKE